MLGLSTSRVRSACAFALCAGLAGACSKSDDSRGTSRVDGDAGPSQQSGGSSGAASGGRSSGGASSGGTGNASSGGVGAGGASSGGMSAAGGASGAAGALGTGGARVYSTDRGEFFGDPRCPADLLFCDDFEADVLDSNTWETQGTAPTVDAVHVARGTRALHAHTTGNGRSLARETKTFPTVNNRYWGRLFVYFDALPTSPQWAHWTILGANGEAGAGEIRVGGQFDGKTNRFGVGTDGGPTGDWTNLDGDPSGAVKPAPEGQWTCIEWLHDGSADETRFFWDGVEHPSLDTTSSDHGHGQGIDPSIPYEMPEMTSVWVGWWLYQGSPTPDHFDVWIDSVAIDDERIGCDY